MARSVVFVLFASVAFGLFADEPMLGTELEDIVSNEVRVPRWEKQFVSVDGNGNLVDPSHKVGSLMDAAYLDEISSTVGEITAAATNALAADRTRLVNGLANMEDRCFSVKLDIPPSMFRTNLTFYAPAEYYDAVENADVLYVWINRELSLKPNMSCKYEMSPTESLVVSGEWVDWANDDYTRDGFPHCKRLKFKRPASASGVLCCGASHFVLGCPETGFSFGSTIVTVNGRPTVTGFYTNRVDGLVYYINNGAFSKITELGGESE